MDGEILFKWDKNYSIIVKMFGLNETVRFKGNNGWSDVEIKVTADELSVYVDGVLRYARKGDFHNRESRIGLRTLRVGDPKCTVSVRQFTISY